MSMSAALALAFAPIAVPLSAQAPAVAPPAAPALAAATRQDLTCAAVFAIVASEQQRGVPSALAFPPLAVRGKEFFVRTAARAMDEARLDRAAVRGLLEAEVAGLQREATASSAPDQVVATAIAPCLARLDAVVAQLARPGLAQCTAIMQIGYEELYAKEGLSDRARDVKLLASVLESREREALMARGLGTDAVDKAVIESHDKMLAEAAADDGGVDKYDLQVCYDFAKPDEKKHY